MTDLKKVADYFGSKKGLLRYYTYEFLRILGVYSKFKRVDFTKVKRLVFVCHGNICRSPLGEAVARHHNIPTTSFGLDTRGGDPADPRAIAWASLNGYNLMSTKPNLLINMFQLMVTCLSGWNPNIPARLNTDLESNQSKLH
ncbi:MAG: hypothetical protein IPK77_06345 [Cellvibrio sp.]|nr:hypothetical protein [Cellvibrio sp.]